VLVGLEAARRARDRSLEGVAADRLATIALLAVAVTIAGGLGLLAGGARPREPLHFVYAVLALGLLPVSTSLSARWEPRRRGIVRLLGALIALAVILRLFATG
jgi:hypothetical protein